MEIIRHSFFYFLLSFAYGFTIWSVYGCTDALQSLLKIPKVFRWFGDLIFWTIAALVTFQMMFRVNLGELRGYSVLGLILGMWLSSFMQEKS